jgi:phosphoglycerol transferase MdoB-like AlkP superfamily enzyme
MSERNGTLLTFMLEFKYISIDKPSGYSTEKAEQILNEYNGNEIKDSSSDTDNKLEQDLPNIIVVMNEALSDPLVLGDFETNQDYMPYIHSIMNGEVENTISGYLNVSVLGGGTENTEFEFLTGNTMTFFPTGAAVYQEYLRNKTDSLVSQLNEIGYKTVSNHPYYSWSWNREEVYKLLGFDESYFFDDYTDVEYVRQFTGDKTCYDRIIETYENKEDNTPLFMFSITMQNHSSYDDNAIDQTIKVVDSESASLNEYLSLMKISDNSFKYLIDYFESVDEDTIIVMFGDHQPSKSVTSNIMVQNGKNLSKLSDEDTYNYYKVPYIIWTNFDTETKTNQDTSANYLANHVLNIAGIQLNSYEQFLANLETQYPILTAIRTEDANGNSYNTIDILDNLNEYQILQYYRLFRNK